MFARKNPSRTLLSTLLFVLGVALEVSNPLTTIKNFDLLKTTESRSDWIAQPIACCLVRIARFCRQKITVYEVVGIVTTAGCKSDLREKHEKRVAECRFNDFGAARANVGPPTNLMPS